MFNTITKKFPILLLMIGLFMASCSDNSVTVEEEEEKLENSIVFQVENRTVTTDAVASYCMKNGQEHLAVSNKLELLPDSLAIDLWDSAEGDYVFQMYDGELGEFSLGTAVFGEALTGVDLKQIVTMVNVEYEITSNDGTTVSGSMTGDFLYFNELGEVQGTLPVEAAFNAEIVKESSQCD